MSNIRFAFRTLLKRPGGTLIILITLSLVIGSMSLVMAVLQHERTAWMPFPDPDRVVRLWKVTKNGPSDQLHVEEFIEAAAALRSFEVIGAMGNYGSQVLTGVGEPKTLSIQHISPSVLEVAGVAPALGRAFTADEVRSGAANLLLISHRCWQAEFSGDPEIIGRAVSLNEKPATIIGVMPKGYDRNGLFYGLDGWLPRDFETAGSAVGFIKVVGRGRAGISSARLNAELAAVMSPLVRRHAENRGWPTPEASVLALRADKRLKVHFEPEQVFGIAIPVFVLGIAAFNIANILLARMLSRRHEFAVRFTLGARRFRIVRQLLGESVLLALLGGIVGLVSSVWIARLTARYGIGVEFSPLVIAGTLLFAGLAGLVVGWLPAWRSTRGELVTDLKESGGIGSGGSARRHRLRNFLMIGQVAMAAALCLGAGLLVRSYQNKKSFPPGFDVSRFLTVHSSLNDRIYPTPESRQLYVGQAMERIAGVPGVGEVSLTSDRVLMRYPFPSGFRFEGQDNGQEGQWVRLTVASPNHLSHVNVPIVRGRPLGSADRRGSPPVLLVSESFVRSYSPNEDPIGRRVGIDVEAGRSWLEIVGVVPDRRNLGYEEHLGPEAYLSADQFFPHWSGVAFVVECRGDPTTLRQPIREAVQAGDPNVPVTHPRSVRAELDEAIGRSLLETRAIALIAIFGLIMAMLGIYGVVSYSVTERTYELGVRMALGADRGEILRLVVRQGLRYAGTGLAIGLVLGGLTTLGLRRMLFGIGVLDWVSYAAVCALFVLTALLASWFPARRASNVEPLRALRHE
ncbi:MAG: ABC transporter permease [Verrucomicrobiae bacterium]|nr:ABC transporter permease [Verrucomicrobiae bacterium]